MTTVNDGLGPALDHRGESWREVFTHQLIIMLRDCRSLGISFPTCLAIARRMHNAEVRAEADATPIEEVTGTGPRK